MTKLRRNKLKLAKNKIKNTRSKLKNIINWGTYFKHEISINQNGVVSGKMTSFYIYIYISQITKTLFGVWKNNTSSHAWQLYNPLFFMILTWLWLLFSLSHTSQNVKQHIISLSCMCTMLLVKKYVMILWNYYKIGAKRTP